MGFLTARITTPAAEERFLRSALAEVNPSSNGRGVPGLRLAAEQTRPTSRRTRGGTAKSPVPQRISGRRRRAQLAPRTRAIHLVHRVNSSFGSSLTRLVANLQVNRIVEVPSPRTGNLSDGERLPLGSAGGGRGHPERQLRVEVGDLVRGGRVLAAEPPRYVDAEGQQGASRVGDIGRIEHTRVAAPFEH